MNKRDLNYLKKIYFDLSELGECLIVSTLISIAIQVGELAFFTHSGAGITNITFPIFIFILTLIIGQLVSTTHTAIGSMPVKSAWSARVASFSLDFFILVLFIASIIIIAVTGYGEFILPRIISTLFLYALAHVFLYTTSVPGGSRNGLIDTTGAGTSFLTGIVLYIVGVIAVAGFQVIDRSFTADSFSDLSSGKQIIYLVLLGVGLIFAVVSRIVSCRGIDSKLRLMKIYRKKKKKEKQESYI